MAKVQNTLIGRASGSVGGSTFTTWKGINVLKSKAVSVANPRTLGQVSQRSRLSVMVAIYRLLAEIITIGFKTRAIGKSAYNAFTSSNILDATTVDAQGVASVNYPNLKLALGTMGSLQIDGVTAGAGQSQCEVEFDDSASPIGSNINDLAYMVAYNVRLNEWIASSGTARSNGTADANFSANILAGDTIHTYLFFKSFDSADVCDSVYAVHTA
ncbi:MAG: DUF6266 family protein [Vibrio anguillarum]